MPPKKYVKKRVPKRKLRLTRYMRRHKIPDQVHHFERTFFLAGISNQAPAGVATPFGLAYSFTWSMLPNVTDFTNLYDQYKIKKIILFIEPTFDSNLISNRADSIASISVAHDYGDDVAPATENEVMEYSNCKRYRMNRPAKITLYPKIQTMEYKTAVTTGYGTTSSNKVWLNTADSTIPHYGLKMWFPAISVNVFLTWKVYGKMIFDCRNSK